MAANLTKTKTTRHYVPIEEERNITYEVVLPE